MKTIEVIKLLALIAITVFINGLFFEYCVSRDMESWITLCLSVLLIAFDVLAVTVLAKILKKALNF